LATKVGDLNRGYLGIFETVADILAGEVVDAGLVLLSTGHGLRQLKLGGCAHRTSSKGTRNITSALVPNVNQVAPVRRSGHSVPRAARSRPLNWTRNGRAGTAWL
jgi:hypothetical protein